MSFRSFFGARKGNQSQSQYKRTTLHMEALEERALLSAVPLSASEYADLRAEYAEFNLPANMADLNVITLDLAEGDGLSQLKSAISTAGTTTQSDLIVVRTTNMAGNSGYMMRYSSASDELSINIDSTIYGSITIIGLRSSSNFTLEADELCRVMTVSGNKTIANFGGISFSGGDSENSVVDPNYGGGIYNLSATITVSNCSFNENSASYNGGAIFNSYDGVITVTNCSLENNYANYDGGALYNGMRGTLTVTNSVIIDSGAEHCGGGFYNNTEGTITITDCMISGNEATEYGGGIYNAANATLIVTNSAIESNECEQISGGIYTEGSLMVTNSTISGNSSDGMGGGIVVTGTCSALITNSRITGNSAMMGGGFLIGGYSSLTLTNSVVSGNTASGMAAGGGSVSEESSFTITNSAIVNNTVTGTYNESSGYGGGLVFEGTATITNCTIAGNTATKTGGGIVYNKKPINIYNSIIAGNTAASSADISKWNSSSSAVVTGYYNLSSFTGWSGSGNITYNGTSPFVNAAKGDYRLIPSEQSQAIDKGSNTYANNAGLTSDSKDISGNLRFDNTIDIGAYEHQRNVTYSTVVTTLDDSYDLNDGEWSLREAISCVPIYCGADEYPEITFADGLEGTIILSHGELEIDKTLSIDGDNRITLDGNQITRVIHANAGTAEQPVVLNGLTIQNGYANGGGGIFNDFDAYVKVTNCIFKNNVAYSIDGGGIYNGMRATLTVENSTISENSANNWGGGIFNNTNGSLTITNSVISNNFSSLYGGGIFNNTNASITVTGCTISSNSAESGGGIYNYDASSMTISDSEISRNYASSEGGGIRSGTLQSTSISNLTVLNSTIFQNRSNGSGGGIYVCSTNFNVTNGKIIENTSNLEGGGIATAGCTSTITNCIISGNSAVTAGGVRELAGTLKITNSLISGNTVSDTGGGLQNYRATTTITNSTIADNSASVNGGGIGNTGTVIVKNSIVASNIVNASSNDIYNSKDDLSNTVGSVSGSNNLSSFEGWTSGSNNQTYDSTKALFVNAENGDYHLIYSENSQAIDQGKNSLAVDANGDDLVYDLDNRTRIVNGKVDIGAYEFHTALSAPALSAEATGIDSITVTVGSVPNATGYTLEYSISDDFSDATSQDVSAGSTVITGLNVNTTYYFRAVALGSADYDDSDFSETASATTEKVQLSAPTLTAEATGSDSVTVTVGEVDNASGYTVEYSTSDNFANATSQDVSVGSTVITGLNANTTYYFRTFAIGTGDYSDSDYSETASATTEKVQLSAPTLTAEAMGSDSVTVTVGEVDNASGYTLEYSTSDDFANATSQDVSAGSTVIAGLTAETTYYFRVMALGMGDYSNSDYSETASATTLAEPVTADAVVNARIVFQDSLTTVDTSADLPEGISSIRAGKTVYADIWLKDVEDTDPAIIGAYMNMLYDSEALTVQNVTYGTVFTQFNNFQDVSVPGVIDLIGGGVTQGVMNKGDDEWIRLATVSFVVDTEGDTTVSLTPPTDYHDNVTLVGGVILTNDQIDFGSAVLEVSAACPMDIDGDGYIGLSDYSLLSAAWRSSPGKDNWNPACDIDGDGYVGLSDYSFLSSNWRKYATDPDLVYPGANASPAALVSDFVLGVLDQPALEPESSVVSLAAAAVSEENSGDLDNPIALEADETAKICLTAVSSKTASDVAADVPASLTEINPGDSFFVEIWVRNVNGYQGSNLCGLLGGYLNMSYPSDLLTVGDVTYGSVFTLFNNYQNASVPGVIDLIGGAVAQGVKDKGDDEWVRLATVAFTASEKGDALIESLPPTDSHDNLTLTSSVTLQNDEIDYGSLTLSIGSVVIQLTVQNDFVKTTLNNPVVIDYRENDTVSDWSETTVQFGDASYGEYAVNEDGTISYTPEEGFYGTDAVSYVVVGSSGELATGAIVINVGLPIAASVQTTSGSHSPSSAMAPSVPSVTDWDDCYVELWAQGVNELNPGETTLTLEYNPAVYDAPTFSACADGVALTVSQSSVLPNGNVQVELTAQVSEPLASQTDNLFLGTVVLTPSMEEGSGVDGAAVPVIGLDGSESQTTVESMPYDLIRNGAVDVNDFIAFATVYGYVPENVSPENPLYAQTAKADFNNDGIVNVADFILFATNYGAKKKTSEKPTAQAGASVPQMLSEEIENEVFVIQIADPDNSVQETSNSQLITLNSQPEVESSMTLLQAYSSALLDLYDNQNEQLQPSSELSAPAIDAALYQDDELDFLFDETDSDSSDSSDVDLSVVLDELELEFA